MFDYGDSPSTPFFELFFFYFFCRIAVYYVVLQAIHALVLYERYIALSGDKECHIAIRSILGEGLQSIK